MQLVITLCLDQGCCGAGGWAAGICQHLGHYRDLTPISAQQLLCGKATELRRWCTPNWRTKVRVTMATNSGPPSDESSSGMP